MGQANKKQRQCPAVGRGIGAAECGENRVSHYRCPADCPYNPWAPDAYDQEMAIETAFFDRLRRYAAVEPMAGIDVASPSEAMIVMQDRHLRHWFIERDAHGRTLMDRWEQAGFPGLNNDQRVLARLHAQVRLMVMETLDHVGRDRVRVQDRLALDTPPIVVQDRSLAAKSGRFSRLIAWGFPLPHYSRITMAAVPVAEAGSLEAEEIVGAIAGHLGGPAQGEPLREWMTAHFLLLQKALGSVQEAMRRKMFENVVYTKTFYRLSAPVETFVKTMEATPEAVATPPSASDRREGVTREWAWLDTDADALRKAPGAGRPTLGRVLLSEGKVRLEGGGTDRAQRFQEAFEQRAGNAVVFESRRVDDVGKQKISRDAKPFDPNLVPPRLLELAPKIETTVHLMDASAAVSADDFMRDRQRQWVDEPVPALDGKTPRQAAGEPALRPKLAALVKETIRRGDRNGLERERFEDEGWIAVELGLTELQLPVPPLLAELADRPKSAQADDGTSDFDEDDVDSVPASTFDDLSAIFDDDGAMEALEESLLSECPDLDGWVGDVTRDLDIDESRHIARLVTLAWSTFHPDDDETFRPNIDRLHREMQLLMQKADAKAADPHAMLDDLRPKRHQELHMFLCLQLVGGSIEEDPSRSPLSQAAILLGLFVIRAVIDEFDRAAARL